MTAAAAWPASSTPIRLLVRHIRTGDRVVVCGRPETVARIERTGSQIDLYVVGGSRAHSFSDSALIGRLRPVPMPPTNAVDVHEALRRQQ